MIKNIKQLIAIFSMFFLMACETLKNNQSHIVTETKKEELPVVQPRLLSLKLEVSPAVERKIKEFSQDFEIANNVRLVFSNENQASVTTLPLTETITQELLETKTSIYYPFLIEKPVLLSDRILNTNPSKLLSIDELQDNLVNWATDVRMGNSLHTAKSCGYSTDYVIWHFLQKSPHYFSLAQKKKKSTVSLDYFELQLNNLLGVREISLLKSWFDSGLLELPKLVLPKNEVATKTAREKWLLNHCGMISDWSGTISQGDGMKSTFSIPLNLPFIRGFVFVINEKTSAEEQKVAQLWLNWVAKNSEKWTEKTGFYTGYDLSEELFLLNPEDTEKNHILDLENTLLTLLHTAFSGIPAMVAVKNKKLLQF